MKSWSFFVLPYLLLPVAGLAGYAMSSHLPLAHAALQQTTRDIVNPSKNPADDAKPNSASVRDVYATTGHFDHVVVLRFKYKANLLAGLEKIVA